MRLLLVKPKHIGDTLILTPTLQALHHTFPQAEIWVVVRQGCSSILRGCPFLHQVLHLAAVDRTERRWIDLLSEANTWRLLLTTSFDYVFELGDGHRGRFLSSMIGTKHRHSVKPASPLSPVLARAFSVSRLDWDHLHRVEKDFFTVREVLPQIPSSPPPLCFQRSETDSWEPAKKWKNFAVLQLGKRQTISRWPLERWVEVGKKLLPDLDGLILSTGPAPDEVAEAVELEAALGHKAQATRGLVDWPQMAGLLYRARYYVGVDTAAMHLAAACSCPIVALFGPTWEKHWAPWRQPALILHGNKPAQTHAECKERAMTDISVADVVAACKSIPARTHLRNAPGTDSPPP